MKVQFNKPFAKSEGFALFLNLQVDVDLSKNWQGENHTNE